MPPTRKTQPMRKKVHARNLMQVIPSPVLNLINHKQTFSKPNPLHTRRRHTTITTGRNTLIQNWLNIIIVPRANELRSRNSALFFFLLDELADLPRADKPQHDGGAEVHEAREEDGAGVGAVVETYDFEADGFRDYGFGSWCVSRYVSVVIDLSRDG